MAAAWSPWWPWMHSLPLDGTPSQSPTAAGAPAVSTAT